MWTLRQSGLHRTDNYPPNALVRNLGIWGFLLFIPWRGFTRIQDHGKAGVPQDQAEIPHDPGKAGSHRTITGRGGVKGLPSVNSGH